MATFEPEMGQFIFGNTPYFSCTMQKHVEHGLFILGDLLVEKKLCTHSPASNSGEIFENDVFAMRAYCWCDGEQSGHEEGCPVNFQYQDFEVTWYKYLSRGSSQNCVISISDWEIILKDCMDSLDSSPKRELT